jgi:hypothetical protein
MTKLSTAFGNKFDKDSLRIRSFVLNGHTFKVKVPLTAETDAMFERAKIIDEEKVEKYYDDLAKDFVENKDRYANDADVVYEDQDILVKGTSLKVTARNKVQTENRITEMIRLLVPENKDFDMSTVTYEEIDELFPFSVQLEFLDEINKTIAPGYVSTRGK